MNSLTKRLRHRRPQSVRPARRASISAPDGGPQMSILPLLLGTICDLMQREFFVKEEHGAAEGEPSNTDLQPQV